MVDHDVQLQHILQQLLMVYLIMVKNENIFIVDNSNVKFDEFGAVPAQHHNV